MNRQRRVAILAVFALVASLLSVFGSTAPPAQAATSADARMFDPGNIISDALFFDGAAMSSAQVQAFLNSKVSSCLSGYVCLKDYRQATTNRVADAGNCSAYTGRPNETAAEIITRVGAACGISQKALLVLLQKETSLVTDTWPTDGEYRKATGYGCPDTANCDSAYYGFFNQVYMAAIQFKWYAANPQRFGHKPGYVNNVRFHPNASCGTSPVFIRNQATAGLYNYTPYQPNTAALNNLEGTGDGCSSYGNRNFWRLYTDWFGSPTGASSLARTDGNSTVYLISNGVKYPVPSMALLNDLSPLGPVGFVSQSYLDRFQTKQNAGRVIRGEKEMFFFGAGYKLKFETCGLVADYGGSCASDGFMQLTSLQIDAFTTGPAMKSVIGTTDGARYYVTAGTRREILDAQSQAEAGIPVGYNVLTEGAVSSLAFGVPIVRDSVFATQRGSKTYFLLTGGSKYSVESSATSTAGLPARSAGSLRAESFAKLPSGATKFSGIVRASASGTNQILADGGRYEWAGVGAKIKFVQTSQAFVDSYSLKGRIQPGSMVKTPTNGTVYVVMDTKILPIGSWETMIALSNGVTPKISTLPAAAIAGLPTGPVALRPPTLVRSPENATVYLVNGVTNKVGFSSFLYASEAGFDEFTVTTKERLAAYPNAPDLLTFGLSCEATKFISAGGKVHKVDPALESLYPFTYVPLDKFTCQLLKVGADATQFIRTPDGGIYFLADGQRHPVLSMKRFAELSQGQSWLDVSKQLAEMIPLGAAA